MTRGISRRSATAMLALGSTFGPALMSRAERAAYDAPFPSEAYKAGARIYPSLVPIEAGIPGCEDNRRAWQVFEGWTKPFLCCFSDGDPITRGLDREFRRRVPGTAGQPHTTLHGGHFLQEDDPLRFAELVKTACLPR